MSEPRAQVLTVGHSNHTLDVFLALLRQHGVTAVADVRSAPYSRFAPQFNRDCLEGNLRTNGITYVFLGRELGARSEDPSCYENGRVQYERLAQTDIFRSGIERVVRGTLEYRIALMCAEKDPLNCHRCILVAPALDARDVDVQHILPDGRLESHRDAMERLLDVTGMHHEDLYRTNKQLIQDALSRQEERIAYRDDGSAEEPGQETP